MLLRKFELEDQSWFPDVLRDYMTDYLRFLFHTLDLYRPAVHILKNSLEQLRNTQQIIDLCSGSGGTIEKIRDRFTKEYKQPLKFVLTDLYPRYHAYQYLSRKTENAISFVEHPVDATNVPIHLHGFRTMFSGIHHFNREQVRDIIRNTIEANQGIAIFDGGDRNVAIMLLILIFHPIALLLGTPFIKPFRWQRLAFTYLIPVVPICTVWDGLISILNLYNPSQLLSIARELDDNHYKWEAGKVRNKFGLRIMYFTGIPSV